MKISRLKKAQKYLNYYSNHFGFRIPYQVLIDATFCYAALQNKIAIEEQLERYFQTQVKYITTQCIILEAESLGSKLVGASLIVKKFFVHKCGHEGKPVSGSDCVLSMIKNARYVIATQDRSLQAVLRKKPGQPIMYLHKCTPILEPPSDVTKSYITKKVQKLVSVQGEEKQKFEKLKQLSGIEHKANVVHQHKKKKAKNPNPLSCKKKKPKDQSVVKKRKRQRSKPKT